MFSKHSFLHQWSHDLPGPVRSAAVSPDSCEPPHPPPAAPVERSSPPPAGEYDYWGLVSDGSPPGAAPKWRWTFVQFSLTYRMHSVWVKDKCSEILNVTCVSCSWLSSPVTSLAVLITFLSASSSKADTLSSSVCLERYHSQSRLPMWEKWHLKCEWKWKKKIAVYLWLTFFVMAFKTVLALFISNIYMEWSKYILHFIFDSFHFRTQG